MKQKTKNKLKCLIAHHDWRNFELPWDDRGAMHNLFRKYLWCPSCHKAYAISPYEGSVEPRQMWSHKNKKWILCPDLISIKDKEQFFKDTVMFQLL